MHRGQTWGRLRAEAALATGKDPFRTPVSGAQGHATLVLGPGGRGVTQAAVRLCPGGLIDRKRPEGELRRQVAERVVEDVSVLP